MLGGMTRHMLPGPGVPHLHVNSPLMLQKL